MKTLAEFIARETNDYILNFCRNVEHAGRSSKLKRRWQKRHDYYKGRFSLAALAEANCNYVFIATVAERGSNGRCRNVLVKDVHPFGVKTICEDHLWLPYDRLWCAIEPFFQGWQVLLVGKAVAYTRLNGTADFKIEPEYITTLLSREQLNRTRPRHAIGYSHKGIDPTPHANVLGDRTPILPLLPASQTEQAHSLTPHI